MPEWEGEISDDPESGNLVIVKFRSATAETGILFEVKGGKDENAQKALKIKD